MLVAYVALILLSVRSTYGVSYYCVAADALILAAYCNMTGATSVTPSSWMDNAGRNSPRKSIFDGYVSAMSRDQLLDVSRRTYDDINYEKALFSDELCAETDMHVIREFMDIICNVMRHAEQSDIHTLRFVHTIYLEFRGICSVMGVCGIHISPFDLAGYLSISREPVLKSKITIMSFLLQGVC